MTMFTMIKQENLLVHLMNVPQCKVAADPQTKPTDLDHESASMLLLSTPTTAQKLTLILPYQ